MIVRRRFRFILLVAVTVVLVSACGPVGPHRSGPVVTSKKSHSLYRWPPISVYPPFAGTVVRSNFCVVSHQLAALTSSTPKIVDCWVGKVSGHSFLYAAFYSPNKQGWQITIDGHTSIGDTNGIPDLYQFGGDFGCTGSPAAAWMEAIDLATGWSYNPLSTPATAKLVARFCASPNNPKVLEGKYIIGLPGHVSKDTN